MTDTNNTLKEAVLSNKGNGNGNGSSSSRRLLDRKGPSSSGKRGWLESTLSFTRLASFKEDTYVVSELKDSERKALQELKDTMTTMGDDASVWGITLTPRGQGEEDADEDEEERREVLLLKFLRAREFRVAEAMEMLRKCVAWRKSYGADAIVEEKIDLDDGVDLGSVAYMHGTDRDGHPVCYNAYGVFKDRGVYDKIFGDDEKLKKFLRWRVQVLEKGIRLLDFRPGGVNSMIQITDLLNMPKRELREASNQILALFQDNYPELVAKKVFINVPWYFSVLYTMISPFLTQRTKSKFVIASEGKVAETLYKFIPPENIPFQYGGLSRPKDVEFGPQKPAAEFTIRAGEKINLEIEDVEDGSTVVWDLVVGGWNVTYLAEFVPSAEGNYSVLIEKSRMMSPSDEPIFNSFKACEAGKVVLIIDNTLSNRKKVAAYRYMIKRT